jgi:hypothetical protein
MPKPPNGTPGKKPLTPSVIHRQPTLLLRKTKAQSLLSGWNPNIWGEDDYCIRDGDVVVGRILPGDHQRRAEMDVVPSDQACAAAERGVVGSLEEAKARFKARYQEVKADREPRE